MKKERNKQTNKQKEQTNKHMKKERRNTTKRERKKERKKEKWHIPMSDVPSLFHLGHACTPTRDVLRLSKFGIESSYRFLGCS